MIATIAPSFENIYYQKGHGFVLFSRGYNTNDRRSGRQHGRGDENDMGVAVMSYTIARNRSANSDLNKLYAEDRSIHEWYRFVLSFPPHLVRSYLERFGITHEQRVLD